MPMMKCLKISIGIALFVAIGLAATPAAYAVESFGVGARPANPKADNPRTQSIFVYQLAPGASASDAVLIINNADKKKTINIYGVDSQNSSDGAFACAQAADAKKSVGNWLSLEQAQVSLEPGQQTKVPFTITIPPSADVGEHNGCIAVQAVDAVDSTNHNGISLSFRSALRVAVTVPGELKSELKVDAVNYDITNDKLVVTPTFKNVGNISVDAKITSRVDSLFGALVEAARGTFPVLRDATGTFNFETNRPFWGGYYTLATSASYKPLSGDGAERQTNEVSQAVFIPPHPLALLVEILVVLIVIGAIAYVIWRKRRHVEHMRFSRHHTIKTGEDVESIAADYGVSWKLVARINKLKPPYTLKPGEKILIPGTRKPHKSE